jgi:hypothetical protein
VIRVAFDPFLSLGPSWIGGDTSWQSTGDEVSPSAAISPGDHGLRNPELAPTSGYWSFVAGFAARRRWMPGDRFGLVARSRVDGHATASCTIECDASTCRGHQRFGTQHFSGQLPGLPARPYPPSVDTIGFACDFDTVSSGTLGLPDTEIEPELITVPDIPITYFEALHAVKPPGTRPGAAAARLPLTGHLAPRSGEVSLAAPRRRHGILRCSRSRRLGRLHRNSV